MIQYNEKQLACIKHPPSPLMIIAGAGTGKTTTIIGRIGYLIKERKIKPDNILALTYTVKAAEHLQKSIKEIVGDKGKNIHACNFHSFALDLSTEYYKKLGYKKEPTLIELSECNHLISQIINDNLSILESQEYKKRNPKAIELIPSIFYQISDELISTDILKKEKETLLKNENRNELENQLLDSINLFFIYTETKRNNSWMDFGDMIVNLWKLLNDDRFLSALKASYQHLIVDEFQDNNYALSRILEKMSGIGGSITIVGDDDQSIYSFRGAHVSGFNEFRVFHKNSKNYQEIVLDKNYRSTQSILDFSNEIVENNSDRLKDKPLKSDKINNSDVILYAGNKSAQIAQIIKVIFKYIKEGVSPSDISVLTRSRSNAIQVSDYLKNKNIKCSNVSDKLFETDTAKDFISFVNIIYNDNSQSLGIYRILDRSNVSELLVEQGFVDKFINWGKDTSLNNLTEDKKNNDFEALKMFLTRNNTCSYGLIIDLYREFSNRFIRFEQSEVVITELDKIISKYILSFKDKIEGNLCNYLNTLFIENDIYIQIDDFDSNSVSVMTIHQSKGMEFEIVLIPFLSSGVFPASNHKSKFLNKLPVNITNSSATLEKDNIEEERRVFHVASTRAREKLFLFAPIDRRSKFFKSINNEMYNEIDITDFDEPHLEPYKEKYKYTKNKNPSYSSTSLALYERCPLAYKYNFVDNIKTSKYSPESLVGIYLHNALEKIYNSKNDSEENIKQLFDESWNLNSFLDIYQSEEFKKEALSIILNYMRNNPIDKDLTYYLEHEIKIEIDSNTFRGKLDRLDIGNDNSITVVDYKTSKSKKTVSSVRKELQLAYYCFLLYKSNKVPIKFPIKSKLIFLRHYEESDVILEMTVEDIKEIENRIENIINGIGENKFNPKKNSYCYFCEYKRLLCPLYK